MKTLILALLYYSVLFSGNLSSAYEKLNPSQIYILNETYQKGKEFDLGLTMAAIAWHS